MKAIKMDEVVLKPFVGCLRYFVRPLYISAFPECEGGIRIRGNCSRYVTGFGALFHHRDSGESVRL